MSNKNCGHHRFGNQKCLKVVIEKPPKPEPFIGMSVFKRRDQIVDSNMTEPQKITQWSDERIDGMKRFYIEPDFSFNTVTGVYTITKVGKYRSAVNLQTENNLRPISDVDISIRFSFRINGKVIQEFFSSGVSLETIATTITFQANEGDVIDILAYPVANTTGFYTIKGTIDPSLPDNPIRSNWGLSRFAN